MLHITQWCRRSNPPAAPKVVPVSVTPMMLPMTMTLAYDNTTIIEYSDTTWWITGFNPNYTNVTADQLTVTFTIDFSSRPGMFRDFYSQCADDGWSFDLKNHLAIYSF